MAILGEFLSELWCKFCVAWGGEVAQSVLYLVMGGLSVAVDDVKVIIEVLSKANDGVRLKWSTKHLKGENIELWGKMCSLTASRCSSVVSVWVLTGACATWMFINIFFFLNNCIDDVQKCQPWTRQATSNGNICMILTKNCSKKKSSSNLRVSGSWRREWWSLQTLNRSICPWFVHGLLSKVNFFDT